MPELDEKPTIPPTVFISYSHKDEEWKDRLLPHLAVLESHAHIDVWHDRRIKAGKDWSSEIEAAIGRASVAVLMLSDNFLSSNFILNEEVPRLLQRRQSEGLRIVPVVVEPCLWNQVQWLSKKQLRPKDGRPISGGNDHQIKTELVAIAEEIAAMVKPAVGAVTPSGFVPLPPDKISTAKLPSTCPDVFGREKEHAALDEAWGNPRVNVFSLVAWGGVGKTALVGKWLLDLQRDNYRGAERVYGWSFYSQGAAEGRQVSADPFIAAALKWFGDSDPTAGSPWDKGERLAELVRQRRTLLILDGLEPLQNPPPVETGRIKDPALQSLLRELARQNPGLVVITTRLTLEDLQEFRGSSLVEFDLDNLSPEAGAAYLECLGVKGTKEELQRAAEELGGHALALTLLGKYLTTVHRGDVRQRDKIARLTDEKKQGAHARRVLATYEQWSKGKPELDILQMLGLFDRPAESGALEALRKQPVIKGLTDRLQELSHDDWQYALANLRDARLIAAPDPDHPDTLDCHPLLREYFGEQLKAGNPEAWREAHSRLYEYYKSSAKEYPDTIEEMTPLYAAIGHGCQAGRHREALDEVYWQRISRKDEWFSLKQLGSYGADLAVFAWFFDAPWSKLIGGLCESDQSYILCEAGSCLRATGRLTEAGEATKASLQIYQSISDWTRAAGVAGNMGEIYSVLGNSERALSSCERSVNLADRGGDVFLRLALRTTWAETLHQAGRNQEAQALFREAEEMQKKHQPHCPLLYCRRGFWYCSLLLTQGKQEEVLTRAQQTLQWEEQWHWRLEVALDHLSLGRAHMMQTQSEGTGDYSQAADHLERAVDGLRRAGQQQYTPLGLLARAELRRVKGELDKAQRDLDEAFSIAARSKMRLHETDCHLGYAHLHLARGEKDKARESLDKAKQLIAETGYHRRDREASDLESQISQ